MNKDEFNQFLSEIISRNIQFKRENGITNYVLIAAIIGLIWQLIEILKTFETIKAKELLPVFEYDFTGFVFSYSILVFRAGRLAEVKAINPIRVFWRNENTTSASHLFINFILILPFLLFFTFGILYPPIQERGPFLMFVFYTTIAGCVFYFRKSKITFYKNIIDEEVIRFVGHKKQPKARNNFTILITSYLVIIITFLLAGLFHWLNGKTIGLSLIVNATSLGVILGLIFILLAYLVELEDTSQRSIILQGYQYDFLMGRISQEEVLEYLDEKVIGIPFSPWLIAHEKKLETLVQEKIELEFDQIAQKKTDPESFEKNLQKINRKIDHITYKVKAKVKDICDSNYIQVLDEDIDNINKIIPRFKKMMEE